MLDAALDYARRGWPVLPCNPSTVKPHTKTPYVAADLDHRGKPVKGTGGLYKATTDEATIRTWWQRWPHALVGLRMGKASGVFAIDPDVVKEPGDADGVAAWDALVVECGGIPETYTQATPTGGRHALFRWRPDRPLGNGRGSLPAGIDVRGEGGYIIMAPSQLSDGGAYTAEHTLDIKLVAEAPEWLLKLIETRPAKDQAGPTISERAAASARKRGPRIDLGTRETLYVEEAVRREIDAVAAAPRGMRNHQLNTSAFSLGTLVGAGALDEARAERELFAAAAHLTADEGARATEATLRSGLEAGIAQPRTRILPDDEPEPTRSNGHANGFEHDFPGHGAASADDDFGLKWHGDPDDTPLKEWLVDGMLPKRGVAIAAGQWGTYKTFIVLDLAGAVMTQGEFAGRSVMRRGGVLFLACEGQDEVRIRLTAMVAERAGSDERLPFAWREECPKLTDADAMPMLRKIIGAAVSRMRKEFDVDIVMMAIDTLMAGADFKDANDPAEAQRVFGMLNKLAVEFSMLVLVVDHFGKIVETGTRNSSAKEGAAEAVLALLGERDTAGNVSNPRLAIRKMRGARTGLEIKFSPRVVEVFDGTMMHSTLVIDWGDGDREAGDAKPAKPAWRGKAVLLKEAIERAMLDFGNEIVPIATMPKVKAVAREKIRDEFYARYTADTKDAKRKALTRMIDDALVKGLIASQEVVGEDWIWFARDEPERPAASYDFNTARPNDLTPYL